MDNKLSRKTITDHDCELLALYASTLSHLYSRRQAIEALKESEEKYRKLFESSTDAIVLVRAEDDRILDANPRCKELFGHSYDDLTNMTWQDLIPKDEIPAAATLKDRLLETGRMTDIEGYHYLRKDGERLPGSFSASTFESKYGPLGFIQIRDISERKKAEEQLKRLAQAIENAGEGICILDRNWRITYCNAAMVHMFERDSSTEIIGRKWSSFIMHETSQGGNQPTSLIESKGKWQGECSGKCGADRTQPLAATLARLGPSDGDYLIIGNIRDMSTEKEHLRRIRMLTEGTEKNLEKERARIARELHDELGQLLTALNINLALISSRIPEAEPSVAERLTEAIELVNQMTGSVRNLSKSLRPPVLDHSGLLEAMKSHIWEFSQRTGIKCQVDINPKTQNISDPLATTIFRILQETLTNIARHSDATRCEVSVNRVGDNLVIKITDNGKGASSQELAGTNSLGIIGIQERAVSLGGNVTFESKPGNGVCVTARIPW